MSGAAPQTTVSRVTDWGAVIVSVMALTLFLAAVVVAWVTKDSSLGILLGMAGTNAGTAVGYWLGSSAGSAKKTELMSK